MAFMNQSLQILESLLNSANLPQDKLLIKNLYYSGGTDPSEAIVQFREKFKLAYDGIPNKDIRNQLLLAFIAFHFNYGIRAKNYQISFDHPILENIWNEILKVNATGNTDLALDLGLSVVSLNYPPALDYMNVRIDTSADFAPFEVIKHYKCYESAFSQLAKEIQNSRIS